MAFTEEEIRKLFGHEAAEDENINVLKQYYLKSAIYEQLKSNIPLFILVGHKGVGKSALLKVLEADDCDNGDIAIEIRPDDIYQIGNENINLQIREWQEGLSKIIFNKLVASIVEINKSNDNKIKKWIGNVSSLFLRVLGKKLSDLKKSHTDISELEFLEIFKDAVFSEKKVTIYIDDIDRGWKNTNEEVQYISAMINAVRTLSRNICNLRFRIAMRSSVYYSVRKSDESTDKIEGSVLWLKWTNHEILVMLVKRIFNYKGLRCDEKALLGTEQHRLAEHIDCIFESKFHAQGHWENAPMYRVLMSLIRKRPRDLIKLCTLSARKAFENGHEKISTQDLESIFLDYSQGRITDTVNEYKTELENLEEVLMLMKTTQKELQTTRPCVFDDAQIMVKMRSVIDQCAIKWYTNGEKLDPKNLAQFLYKINFLTARKEDKDKFVQRWYFEEHQYVFSQHTQFGFDCEVHPAYRWALQPSNIKTIYDSLKLSKD
ncbi:MAG: hypothetical protein FWE84_02140 [Firmicutes bacterium]|nr:hypothetical protein [Bacillota bacterium]